MLCCLALSSTGAFGQAIAPVDARRHLGESVTVCGLVTAIHRPDFRPSTPVFLNLGEPTPLRQELRVLVPGAFAATQDLNRWWGRSICLSGRVEGVVLEPGLRVPQMMWTSINQLRVGPRRVI